MLVQAAPIPINEVPVGKVFSVNGMKFAKIGNDPVKGSQFATVCENNYCERDPNCLSCSTKDWNYCTQCIDRYKPVGGTCVPETYPTMQDWDGCSELATPSATLFTQGPILSDARDGKSYEIRKFADGKCWMVENLMYGGTSDNCSGNGAAQYTDATYGGANGRTTPSNRFGAGTYGNCRDPRVDAAASSPCYNSTACGYYYNWQAVMQLSSAYHGVNVTYPNGTPSSDTNFHQGICPTGWHVPAGSTTGEFQALHLANGSQASFWSGDIFKGVYSGFCYSSGALSSQGAGGYYWSSMQSDASGAYYLYFNSSGVLPAYSHYKGYGFAVRCIKNDS